MRFRGPARGAAGCGSVSSAGRTGFENLQEEAEERLRALRTEIRGSRGCPRGAPGRAAAGNGRQAGTKFRGEANRSPELRTARQGEQPEDSPTEKNCRRGPRLAPGRAGSTRGDRGDVLAVYICRPRACPFQLEQVRPSPGIRFAILRSRFSRPERAREDARVRATLEGGRAWRWGNGLFSSIAFDAPDEGLTVLGRNGSDSRCPARRRNVSWHSGGIGQRPAIACSAARVALGGRGA